MNSPLSETGRERDPWRALRGQAIPSRYFLAPINTGLADTGVPSKRFLDFYRTRSSPSIGVVYVGNVAVGEVYRTNPGTAVISDHPLWRILSHDIAERGSVPGIQLACRLPGEAPQRAWAREDVSSYICLAAQRLSSLTATQIQDIEKAFANGIVEAGGAGFTLVQVHAAHGYFASQLLCRATNVRNDEYRWPAYRFFENIVAHARDAVPHLILDIRVSLLEGIRPAEEELISRMPMVAGLARLGFDMVSVSAGHYDIDKSLIYPTVDRGPAPYAPAVIHLARREPKVVWNVAGNIWDLRSLEAATYPDNVTFSIGRSLIADPQFVEKALREEHGEKGCKRCGLCHYFTRGRPYIECPQSPDLPTNPL